MSPGDFFLGMGEIRSNRGFFRLSGAPFDGTQKDHYQDLLYYGGGALMASHHSKGIVLQKFLQNKGLSTRYSCIFFVDDQEENIEHFNQAYQGDTGPKVFIYHAPYAP